MTATTPEKVSVLAGTPLYGGRQEIGALVADAHPLAELGFGEDPDQELLIAGQEAHSR